MVIRVALSCVRFVVLAFLLIYVAALIALFVYAFWTVDPFTSEVVHAWTLDNFRELWQSSTYRNVAQRTILIAAAVTVTDAVIAFPFAYFMARLAGPPVADLRSERPLANEWDRAAAQESPSDKTNGATRRRHAVKCTLSVILGRTVPVDRLPLGESVWLPTPTPVV